MATVRKISTQSLATFGDFAAMFFKSGHRRNVGRNDFVFDVYREEPSPKDSERMRREDKVSCKKLIIHLNNITNETPLPKDFDTFRPSTRNKILLQKFLSRYLQQIHSDVNQTMVIGQAYPESSTLAIEAGHISKRKELDMVFEEADIRIFVHILNAANDGYKSVLVLSSDTDVIVGALYHMRAFHTHGLEELWIRAGVRDSTRYIPLHFLAQRMGRPLHVCDVLPAVHCLTGELQ